ncbi:probable cyclin-dependent serine/threonine-protein kinase DDB_G0292550 isoform X2 [Daktulosphaira vitifoliae]|uniref:probable cyclin-dependent serine/threonine-protein kinase DDB_G0292550 isoform X2 n=1 Tax=Daktulosphaira vitifoliae TaxID=58002 RepID=UPI0021AAC735|nr:probable cyclin-dependent serine/threonine-protein kinase DDB_G0292550 isoform X2 [Daktulosphaira vitifoliae]
MDWKTSMWTVFVVICGLLGVTVGYPVPDHYGCVLRENAGKEQTIGLARLTELFGETLETESNNKKFYVSICRGIPLNGSKSIAGAVQFNAEGEQVILGQIIHADVVINEHTVVLTYINGDINTNPNDICKGNRWKTYLTFICNPYTKNDTLLLMDEDPDQPEICQVVFNIITSKICSQNLKVLFGIIPSHYKSSKIEVNPYKNENNDNYSEHTNKNSQSIHGNEINQWHEKMSEKYDKDLDNNKHGSNSKKSTHMYIIENNTKITENLFNNYENSTQSFNYIYDHSVIQKNENKNKNNTNKVFSDYVKYYEGVKNEPNNHEYKSTDDQIHNMSNFSDQHHNQKINTLNRFELDHHDLENLHNIDYNNVNSKSINNNNTLYWYKNINYTKNVDFVNYQKNIKTEPGYHKLENNNKDSGRYQKNEPNGYENNHYNIQNNNDNNHRIVDNGSFYRFINNTEIKYDRYNKYSFNEPYHINYENISNNSEVTIENSQNIHDYGNRQKNNENYTSDYEEYQNKNNQLNKNGHEVYNNNWYKNINYIENSTYEPSGSENNGNMTDYFQKNTSITNENEKNTPEHVKNGENINIKSHENSVRTPNNREFDIHNSYQPNKNLPNIHENEIKQWYNKNNENINNDKYQKKNHGKSENSFENSQKNDDDEILNLYKINNHTKNNYIEYNEKIKMESNLQEYEYKKPEHHNENLPKIYINDFNNHGYNKTNEHYNLLRHHENRTNMLNSNKKNYYIHKSDQSNDKNSSDIHNIGSNQQHDKNIKHLDFEKYQENKQNNISHYDHENHTYIEYNNENFHGNDNDSLYWTSNNTEIDYIKYYQNSLNNDHEYIINNSKIHPVDSQEISDNEKNQLHEKNYEKHQEISQYDFDRENNPRKPEYSNENFHSIHGNITSTANHKQIYNKIHKNQSDQLTSQKYNIPMETWVNNTYIKHKIDEENKKPVSINQTNSVPFLTNENEKKLPSENHKNKDNQKYNNTIPTSIQNGDNQSNFTNRIDQKNNKNYFPNELDFNSTTYNFKSKEINKNVTLLIDYNKESNHTSNVTNMNSNLILDNLHLNHSVSNSNCSTYGCDNSQQKFPDETNEKLENNENVKLSSNSFGKNGQNYNHNNEIWESLKMNTMKNITKSGTFPSNLFSNTFISVVGAIIILPVAYFSVGTGINRYFRGINGVNQVPHFESIQGFFTSFKRKNHNSGDSDQGNADEKTPLLNSKDNHGSHDSEHESYQKSHNSKNGENNKRKNEKHYGSYQTEKLQNITLEKEIKKDERQEKKRKKRNDKNINKSSDESVIKKPNLKQEPNKDKNTMQTYRSNDNSEIDITDYIEDASVDSQKSDVKVDEDIIEEPTDVIIKSNVTIETAAPTDKIDEIDDNNDKRELIQSENNAEQNDPKHKHQDHSSDKYLEGASLDSQKSVVKTVGDIIEEPTDVNIKSSVTMDTAAPTEKINNKLELNQSANNAEQNDPKHKHKAGGLHFGFGHGDLNIKLGDKKLGFGTHGLSVQKSTDEDDNVIDIGIDQSGLKIKHQDHSSDKYLEGASLDSQKSVVKTVGDIIEKPTDVNIKSSVTMDTAAPTEKINNKLELNQSANNAEQNDPKHKHKAGGLHFGFGHGDLNIKLGDKKLGFGTHGLSVQKSTDEDDNVIDIGIDQSGLKIKHQDHSSDKDLKGVSVDSQKSVVKAVGDIIEEPTDVNIKSSVTDTAAPTEKINNKLELNQSGNNAEQNDPKHKHKAGGLHFGFGSSSSLDAVGAVPLAYINELEENIDNQIFVTEPVDDVNLKNKYLSPKEGFLEHERLASHVKNDLKSTSRASNISEQNPTKKKKKKNFKIMFDNHLQ